jgi:hypothetical protein
MRHGICLAFYHSTRSTCVTSRGHVGCEKARRAEPCAGARLQVSEKPSRDRNDGIVTSAHTLPIRFAARSCRFHAEIPRDSIVPTGRRKGTGKNHAAPPPIDGPAGFRGAAAWSFTVDPAGGNHPHALHPRYTSIHPLHHNHRPPYAHVQSTFPPTPPAAKNRPNSLPSPTGRARCNSSGSGGC